MEKIKVNAYWRKEPYTVNLSSKKSMFKFYVKKTVKLVFAFVIATGSLYLAYSIGSGSFLKSKLSATAMANEIMQGRIDNFKGVILSDLAKCETNGVKDPDGAIILDTNKKMSIGRYQFQRETIIYYYKKFYGQTITNSEAIAIAIDPIKAKNLASKILFSEPKGVDNWLNCSNKLDLSTKVGILKTL